MTLRELISNIDHQNEEATIFAKKVDGKFSPTSEAVVIEIDEDELQTPTQEIAEKQCPGFDYFLEVFLVKEVIENLGTTVGYKSLEKQVERIILYAESDA